MSAPISFTITSCNRLNLLEKTIDSFLSLNNYKTNYGQFWNGYSWNPGLRRKSDYLIMFPDGVSFFEYEYDCSSHTIKFDYLSVSLEETCCYHIGTIRTNNFII